MKVIEQYHEVLSYTNTVLTDIEKAGRTCYKSEDRITDSSAYKFVEMLRDRGHHAMIEFGDATIKFVTNRGVTHELVRHRLCSFAQESTRYVDYEKEMSFIQPVWYGKDEVADHAWRNALVMSEDYYRLLREKGWRPEQAREVLPNSLKTEIVVKANVREWRHIFKLRCAKAAHPQMRALMRNCLDDMKTRMPVVFKDLTY